ncbi:MAG: hypothetical protein ACT4PW_04030 [Acidimicrobiia bacterium]
MTTSMVLWAAASVPVAALLGRLVSGRGRNPVDVVVVRVDTHGRARPERWANDRPTG